MKRVVVILTIIVVFEITTIHFALAQISHIAYAPGISVTNTIINMGIITSLFTLKLIFIKATRKRALAGIAVFIVGMIIVAFITPIIMYSSKPSDKQDFTLYCNEPTCNIVNFNKSLSPNSKLVQIFSYLQEKYLFAKTINYYEEWALTSEIISYSNDVPPFDVLSSNIVDHRFVLKYEGKQYELRFDHPNRYGYYILDPKALHVDIVILLNVVITTVFYFMIYLTRKPRHTKTIN